MKKLKSLSNFRTEAAVAAAAAHTVCTEKMRKEKERKRKGNCTATLAEWLHRI